MTLSVPPVTCHGQGASCTGHPAGNALRARHRSAGRHRARRRTADQFRREDPVQQLTRRTLLSRARTCISVLRRQFRPIIDPTTTRQRVRQSVNGPILASKDTRSFSAHRHQVAQDGQEQRQESYQQPALSSDTQVSHRSCGARAPQRLSSFAATIRPRILLRPCGTVNDCGLLFASRGGPVLNSTSA